jgi:hypothetical protein
MSKTDANKSTAETKVPHLDHLLDESLVGRHGRSLDSVDRGSNPCDQSKLGSLAQLITCLETNISIHSLGICSMRFKVSRR